MANPLYEQMYGNNGMQSFASQMPRIPMFQNPMQKMNYVMQAMWNPRQFVQQAFPDIPNEISGDPNRILQYLQQTRNITNEQIQNTINQMPRF